MRSKVVIGLSTLALCAVFSASFTSAQAKVLAKVNGVEITDEDVKVAAEDIGPAVPRQLEGKAREAYLLDVLIDEQLLVQEAQAQKLAETADFAKRLGYLRDKALSQTVVTKVAKELTTDAAVQQTYDTFVKNQKPDTEYRAHHILVNTEDEAKAIAKRLKAGEDFGKVADEVSKDTGAKGGDLGPWFTKDKMVSEFGDALAKLEPGQISDPVKTQFGWHIIRLDEKRPKVVPTMDQLRQRLEAYVAQKGVTDYIGKLHEKAKIERTDPPADPAKPADAKPADAKK